MFSYADPSYNTGAKTHQNNALSLLCCCSALGRHPAPSTSRCCAAQRVTRHPKTRWWRGRGPQTRCWRQGREPQTRRLPMRYGKAPRISLIMPPFKIVGLANSLRGLAQQRKASSLLRRRRGRAPRGKLRRRNHCCSPLTPLLQLWGPFLLTTGAGLGRQAGYILHSS